MSSIKPGPVAVIGAGVIGGGWTARFLLNGIDVKIFDPNPEAGCLLYTSDAADE